ncbi:hypothetical protein KAW18_17145 [candidate division WOR-3 bacterium]|nr:hypothetical protein [candidate division WOR-3 bacterium]
MKNIGLIINSNILLFLFATSALIGICSCNQSKTTDKTNDNFEKLKIKFNIHTKSSDLLLKWFDNQLDTIMKEILEQPGTQIMAGIVENTLSRNELPTFFDELKNFSINDSLKSDPYGLRLAWFQRDESSLLLNKIKEYNFQGEIVERIKPYIPTDYPLDVECKVYFVLTGWEWGDAMVRKITNIDNHYRVTEQGEPVIIVNLSIITKLYGDDIDILLNDDISHTMSHELFHLVFAEYQNVSSYWKNNRDTTKIGQLVEIIQNEGIAHYLSHNQKQNLIENYNSSNELKEREKEAFKQLSIAVKQLLNTELSNQEKDDILMKSNAGRYWDKFGAIAGKFMVYHIEREYGEQAIQQSLSKGAYYFLELYNKLQIESPTLPSLPEELKKQ